jgi:hypothetical protein
VPREVPGLEKISDVSRAFIFLFQVSGVARLKKPVAFCIDLQNCAHGEGCCKPLLILGSLISCYA